MTPSPAPDRLTTLTNTPRRETMPETCAGCGRFVSKRDPHVIWDVERGEFGVELSRTPITCRGCVDVLRYRCANRRYSGASLDGPCPYAPCPCWPKDGAWRGDATSTHPTET